MPKLYAGTGEISKDREGSFLSTASSLPSARTVESPTILDRRPLQPQFQKGQVFELSEDNFVDLTQNVSSSTQIPGGFHGDFDTLMVDGLPQDQTLEALIRGSDHAQPPSPITWEATALVIRSREPSMAPWAQPTYPTTEDWAGIKPVFTKLYITEDKTLKEVQTILEQDHGFSATERMYRGRIKTWKLHKNLNKDEKATMIRKMRHGKPINQTLLNGRPVWHRLLRYCKENRVSPATLAMNSRDSHSTTPCNTDAHTTSAPPELQSLFKLAFQPAQPIALRGSIRAVEIVMQNIDMYVKHYFTEGPGTWYYKKKFLGDTGQRFDSEAFILVEDEQAWQDVLDPVDVVNSMRHADDAISIGFIESGFRELGNAMDHIKTLFTQQNPELIGNIFVTFFRHFPDGTKLARMIRGLFLEMASIVLGSEHPLSIIVSQLSTLSNVAEKCYVWRALSDVWTTPFSLLEDNTLLTFMKWDCMNGLTDLGSLGEASDYLNMIVLAKWELEKGPTYLLSKGYLLHKQGKYLESKILHQESLENWKDHEQDILAAGKDSESMDWFYAIGDCVFYLAIALENLDEIDEAKALRRRAFDLCCRVRGPDNADTQITGSHFDKFLTRHGYFEESDALRAEYPALLDRKEIPEDFQSRPNGLTSLALAKIRSASYSQNLKPL